MRIEEQAERISHAWFSYGREKAADVLREVMGAQVSAEQERAKIVEYLRACEQIFRDRAASGEMPIKSKNHAESCEFSALAIENGEHWMPLPPSPEKGEG